MNPIVRTIAWAALVFSAVILPPGPPAFQPQAVYAANPGEQALLNRAQVLLESADFEQARLSFQLFLSTYPNSTSRDQVYFGLALIYSGQKDYGRALMYYMKLNEEYPASPFSGKARRETASMYVNLGQFDAAIPLLEGERRLARDPSERQELTDRIVEIYIKKKDRVQAISELLKRDAAGEEERQAQERRVVEVMGGSSRTELEELVRMYPKSFPGDAALINLADRHETARNYFEADRELRRFAAAFPRHKEVSGVRDRIEAIRSRYRGMEHLIGAVLPMSGRLSAFGRQALNGIRLALENPPGGAGGMDRFVDVVVRDSEADPSALLTGYEELVREYGVAAVIGPMLTRQVEALAPRADYFEIPILTPAASGGLSKSWKYVLRGAVTPGRQARETAAYAMNTLNMKRFAILYSDDEYGKSVMRAFSDEAATAGGEIIAALSYDPAARDFGPAVRRLREIDLTKYGVLGPPPEQKGQTQEYTPGFDAVFIPADYNQAGLAAAQIAFFDMQTVTMLGSNGWNAKDLFRIGGKYVEGAIFMDGFFPNSKEPSVRSFVDRYRVRYKEEPTLLSAQAYDSAIFLIQALKEGASTGPRIREFAARPSVLAGATGRIGFTPEGESAKPLYVIQVKNGRFVLMN
ncbi:MAG TPA: penicillin-binding protein activator [Nitrospiria bacterium]